MGTQGLFLYRPSYRAKGQAEWSLFDQGLAAADTELYKRSKDLYMEEHSIFGVTDIITKGPWVDVRSFMDGQSGRPTYATWYANQATTDVTAVIQAVIDSGDEGVHILFPSYSTFCISTALRRNSTAGPGIQKGYYIFDGNNSTIKWIGASGAASMFDMTRMHRSQINNLVFDGNAKTNYCINQDDYSTANIFRRVYMTNTLIGGLALGLTTHANVDGNSYYDLQFNTVNTCVVMGGANVKLNKFYGGTFFGQQYCISGEGTFDFDGGCFGLYDYGFGTTKTALFNITAPSNYYLWRACYAESTNYRILQSQGATGFGSALMEECSWLVSCPDYWIYWGVTIPLELIGNCFGYVDMVNSPRLYISPTVPIHLIGNQFFTQWPSTSDYDNQVDWEDIFDAETWNTIKPYVTADGGNQWIKKDFGSVSLPAIRNGIRLANGTVAPLTHKWSRGDQCDNTTPSAGGPPGWRCVFRSSGHILTTQANAGVTTIEIDDTSDILANDKVGIPLDNGLVHWSYVVAVLGGGRQFTINDPIPTGRYGPNYEYIHFMRWKAMANLAT